MYTYFWNRGNIKYTTKWCISELTYSKEGLLWFFASNIDESEIDLLRSSETAIVLLSRLPRKVNVHHFTLLVPTSYPKRKKCNIDATKWHTTVAVSLFLKRKMHSLLIGSHSCHNVTKFQFYFCSPGRDIRDRAIKGTLVQLFPTIVDVSVNSVRMVEKSAVYFRLLENHAYSISDFVRYASK